MSDNNANDLLAGLRLVNELVTTDRGGGADRGGGSGGPLFVTQTFI